MKLYKFIVIELYLKGNKYSNISLTILKYLPLNIVLSLYVYSVSLQ